MMFLQGPPVGGRLLAIQCGRQSFGKRRTIAQAGPIAGQDAVLVSLSNPISVSMVSSFDRLRVVGPPGD